MKFSYMFFKTDIIFQKPNFLDLKNCILVSAQASNSPKNHLFPKISFLSPFGSQDDPDRCIRETLLCCFWPDNTWWPQLRPREQTRMDPSFIQNCFWSLYARQRCSSYKSSHCYDVWYISTNTGKLYQDFNCLFLFFSYFR